MDITKAHKDTQRLLKSYDSLIQSIMEELEPDMIELNKSQLEIGYKATGERMPKYSDNKAYKKLKEKIGSKSLPYMDFKLTGDFHNDIKAKQYKDGTVLFSVDFKNKYLRKIVPNKEIFGVTNENLNELSEKALDLLENKIRKTLRI